MSLKGDQYETAEETQFRLEGTVVTYDGDPVYIRRVTTAAPGDPKPDIARVYAVPLPHNPAVNPAGGGEEFRKFISSKKFDLTTIKMGFLNDKTKGVVYYCSREPKRQTKQGLSASTFKAVPIGDSGDGKMRGTSGFGKSFFHTAIGMEEFVDMVKGRYPSFGDAMNAIARGEATAVAFSREYAVVKDNDLDGLVYLYHKENKCGFILDDKIKLSKKLRCLKESLAELGLRV